MLPAAIDLLAAVESSPPNVWTILAVLISAVGSSFAVYIGLRKQAIDRESKRDDHAAKEKTADRLLAEKMLDKSNADEASLREEVREIQKTLIEQAKEIGSLRAEVKALKERDREQGIKIGELTEKLAESTTKATELQIALTAERHEHTATKAQLASEKSENAQLIQQNEVLADEVKRLRTAQGK